MGTGGRGRKKRKKEDKAEEDKTNDWNIVEKQKRKRKK